MHHCNNRVRSLFAWDTAWRPSVFPPRPPPPNHPALAPFAQLTTSDVGHTTMARFTMGLPSMPCFSRVYSSEIDCVGEGRNGDEAHSSAARNGTRRDIICAARDSKSRCSPPRHEPAASCPASGGMEETVHVCVQPRQCEHTRGVVVMAGDASPAPPPPPAAPDSRGPCRPQGCIRSRRGP